jgi:hypothetical protein
MPGRPKQDGVLRRSGTLPLIITRTSLDGNVQLMQTFTLNAAERGLDINMAVKNLFPSVLKTVHLTQDYCGSGQSAVSGLPSAVSRLPIWNHPCIRVTTSSVTAASPWFTADRRP